MILGLGLLCAGCRGRSVDGAEAGNDASSSAGQQEQSASWKSTLSGKIVFQSDRDGDWEIFAMNGDGSHLLQLTHNSSYDGYPVWSPDGKEIAFESDRDGNYEIYLMNADGDNQRRLTHHPANESSPAWSPDGARIAFDSDRVSTREMYLMNADGSQVEQWTETLGKNALPAWSPDGNRLAYTGNRYLGWNVYVMTLDKSEDTRITEGHGACRPDWSPDGRKLAYVSHKSDKKGDIWLMNPDGREQQQLTFDSEHADYYPSWSPDGQYIAYAKDEDSGKRDQWDIYAIRSTGGQPVKLTNHSANDTYPDWAEGRVTQELFNRRSFHYEAESLARQIGSIRQDPDASQKKAVYAGDADGEGFVVYGPYQQYAPAEYIATFRLKSDALKSRKAIVRLDVVSDKGQRTLADMKLSGQDFSAPRRYQNFSLPFSLAQERVLEFRVYVFSISGIWVDSIAVNVRNAS